MCYVLTTSAVDLTKSLNTLSTFHLGAQLSGYGANNLVELSCAWGNTRTKWAGAQVLRRLVNPTPLHLRV
ncbi:hypothetical protein J6590_075158 [Homalodisca vitripennis]|nr:hypothetical protein J6590_075158 [Homalodisca vitripennis]